MKKKVDRIFQVSLANSCPTCGKWGQKDDACCHMYCPNCQHSWCYFCETYLPNDVSHFDDWYTDDTNCPQYLNYIYENGNENWPYEPDAAVEFYHSQKLLHNLKLFVKETPESDIK